MQKAHHKDAVYPFACTSCEYNAPNQENLLAHLKIHTDEKPYTCHICSYRSKNRTGINAHLKRKNHAAIRSVRISYKCGICNLQTTNPSDLRNHIIVHIRTPNLIRLELMCNCQYVTKFEEIPIHINDHVKNIHHTEVDALLLMFLCNIVSDRDEQDENFYNPNVTSVHVNAPNTHISHHPNVPLSYNTNFNGYPGNIQGSSQPPHNWHLQNSMQYIHPPVVNNLPPIGSMNASNTSQRDTPMSGMNEIPSYQFPNGTNQVLYQTQPRVSPSTSTKVTVGSTCTLCNYIAYNDSDLNYHVSTHSTVLYDEVTNLPVLFSCNICNFKGGDENELMLHMSTHVLKYNETDDSLDCICDICGYNAFSQANLGVHKLVHFNEETLECNLCGYKTRSVLDLRLHMILHPELRDPAEGTLESDSEETESPGAVNSYEHQDSYDNHQPFVESSSESHQEQFGSPSDHI